MPSRQMPSDPSPFLEPSNALLAAVKPIYLVALGAALVTWSAAGVFRDFRQDIESVKSEVSDIKVLLCRDHAGDTMCQGVTR